MIGQNTLQAAKLRRGLSQIDKYNAAINTFVAKYGNLPGDLTAAKAAAFGFTTRNGAVGRGDGNGQIEGGYTGSSVVWGEIAMFWNDLSTANLIDGTFIGTDSAGTGITTSAATPTRAVLPISDFGQGNYLTVYSDKPCTGSSVGCPVVICLECDGFNYIQTVNVQPITGLIAGLPNVVDSNFGDLTSTQALEIDSKVDDGLPASGNVVTRNNVFGEVAIPTAAGGCQDAGTPPSYSNLNQYKYLCSLSFRISSN